MTSHTIAAVSEKGIVGDILASRRFYRRHRSIAYEEDFGKYFQNLDIRFGFAQIQNKLPNFALRIKPERKSISVTGSASLELRLKMEFVTFVKLVKDLADLMDQTYIPVFNRSLNPIDKRKDHLLIEQLQDALFDKLASFGLDPGQNPFDFDFCNLDFEDFFNSASCELSVSGLTDKKGAQLQPVGTDDVYEMNGTEILSELIKQINTSQQCRVEDDKQLFIKDQLRNVTVTTKDNDGNPSNGKLIEFIQSEIQYDNKFYFLLDENWYQLKNEFDASLNQKYSKRVGELFKIHNFMPKWETGFDEGDFNKLFDKPPSSICLHPIKIDNIELCDSIFVDEKIEKIFILFVKKGLRSSIRDLTSQAFMGARIIEEETLSAQKDKLKRLYASTALNETNISEQDFLRFFLTSANTF